MAWTEVGQTAGAMYRSRGGRGGAGEKSINCPLSALELEREKNVKENEAFLRSLGIETIRDDMRGAQAQRQEQQQAVESKVATRITLQEVRNKWSGRTEQIQQLARLLPPPSECEALPPVLLCYGPRGTGKTGVLRDVMQALEHPHAFIRGREHGSSKALYGAIIKQWVRHAEEADQGDWGMEDMSVIDAMEKSEDVVGSQKDEEEEQDSRQDDDEEEEEEGGLGGGKAQSPKRSKRPYRDAFGGDERESDEEKDDMEGVGDEASYGTTGGRRASGRGEGGDSEGSEASEGEEDERHHNDDDDDEEEEDDDDDTSLAFSGRRRIFRQQQDEHPATSGLGLNTASGLMRLLERWRGQPTSFVVVLDEADQLCRECVHVLRELLELPRTLRAPRVALTVVFVAHDPMILPGGAAMALQLTVPFPSYTKAQIITILQKVVMEAAGLADGQQGPPVFQDLVRTFTNVLVASLYGSTRDVRELKRMAWLLSPHYLKPVLTGGSVTGPIDKPALYEQIRPLLKHAIRDSLYCFDKPLGALPLSDKSIATGLPGKEPMMMAAKAAPETQIHALLRHELPKLSLFLLVAAYLASHNAPATDFFLFTSKNHGKRRSKRSTAEIQEEETAGETGPRVFKLERLLCILTSLITAHRENGADYARATGTVELFVQLNTLVHLRLLSRVNPIAWDFASIKYRCHAGYDVVLQVAKELEIPLNNYLAAGSSTSQ